MKMVFNSLSPDSAIAPMEESSGCSAQAGESPVNDFQTVQIEKTSRNFGVSLGSSQRMTVLSKSDANPAISATRIRNPVKSSLKSDINPIRSPPTIEDSVKSIANPVIFATKIDDSVKSTANLAVFATRIGDPVKPITNPAISATKIGEPVKSTANLKFSSIIPPLTGVEGTRRLAAESALADPLPAATATAISAAAAQRPQLCEQATNYIIKEVELIKTTKTVPAAASSTLYLTQIENNFGVERQRATKIDKIGEDKSSGKENIEEIGGRRRPPPSQSRKSLVKSYDVEVLRRYVFDPRTHTYKMRYVHEVKVMADDDETATDDESKWRAVTLSPLQTSKSFSDFASLKSKDQQNLGNPSLLRYRKPLTVFRHDDLITATAFANNSGRLSERHVSEPDLSAEKKIEPINASQPTFRDTSRTFERNSAIRRPVHTSTSATRKSARQIIAKQQQSQATRNVPGATTAAAAAAATGAGAAKPSANNSQPKGKRPQIIALNASSNKLFRLPIVIQHDDGNQPPNVNDFPKVSKDMLRELLRPLDATARQHQQQQQRVPPSLLPAPQVAPPKIEIKERRNEKATKWPPVFTTTAHSTFRQSFDKQTTPLLGAAFADEDGGRNGGRNHANRGRPFTIHNQTVLGGEEGGQGKNTKKKFANVRRLCCFVVVPVVVLAVLVGIVCVLVW